MDGETGGLTLFDRNDITARCYVRREETIVFGNVKTRFVARFCINHTSDYVLTH